MMFHIVPVVRICCQDLFLLFYCFLLTSSCCSSFFFLLFTLISYDLCRLGAVVTLRAEGEVRGQREAWVPVVRSR